MQIVYIYLSNLYFSYFFIISIERKDKWGFVFLVFYNYIVKKSKYFYPRFLSITFKLVETKQNAGFLWQIPYKILKDIHEPKKNPAIITVYIINA